MEYLKIIKLIKDLSEKLAKFFRLFRRKICKIFASKLRGQKCSKFNNKSFSILLRNVLHRLPSVVIIALSHCRRYTDQISLTAEIVSALIITRSGKSFLA